MNALQGTIKNGQIVLDAPNELPEGTRVEVLPIDVAQPTFGMREEDWPTTPEGIAELLARMDQVEPGWLSPEDEAAWRSALRAEKEIERVKFLEDAEKLAKSWQRAGSYSIPAALEITSTDAETFTSALGPL
jgi:hypothetical protein